MIFKRRAPVDADIDMTDVNVDIDTNADSGADINGDIDAGKGVDPENGTLVRRKSAALSESTFRAAMKRNSWLLALGLASALVTAVRLWVADVVVMRSPAMDPTLTDGDRVVVSKLSYVGRSPERGDILAFHPPKMLQTMRPQATQPFLLRVVALPGDRIQIQGDKLYLNGELQSEPYLTEPGTYDMAEITIPPDTYFVLGDNRNDSFDSSIWGIVPAQQIIGRGISIAYPWDRIGDLSP